MASDSSSSKMGNNLILSCAENSYEYKNLDNTREDIGEVPRDNQRYRFEPYESESEHNSSGYFDQGGERAHAPVGIIQLTDSKC